MIRVTFELLPKGDEGRSRVIGLMEIANLHVTEDNLGSYLVSMKKTPPFKGALRHAWRRGRVHASEAVQANLEFGPDLAGEDQDIIAANFGGFHRQRRGVYDMLYRALVACGIDQRNPDA